MTQKIKVLERVQYGDTIVGGVEKEFDCDAIREYEFELSASQTDTQLDIQVPADSKVVAIVAEGGNVTLKTNSTGTPQETLNLVDGEPQIVTEDFLGTSFLAGAVTTVYYTTGAGVTPVLKVITGK